MLKLLRTTIAALLAGILTTSALAQVTPGTSPLSGAKGGTNNAFMQFSGPAASLKTYALPNVSGTLAMLSQAQTWTGSQNFSAGATINGGSAAFTSGLSFNLSQNASTTGIVSNVNAGNNALAVWTATNGNGSASFGAGGANYSTLSILQNRGYVDAQSGLGGIAINNQGANPIVFGIENTEVGRFTSAHGFNLTPLYQSGNPGNASVLSQTATPPAGNEHLYNAFQVCQGTCIPAAQQFGSDNIPIRQSLVGTTGIGVGEVTVQAHGVAGYALANVPNGVFTNFAGTYSTGNSVGIFGWGGTTVNNANVFGGSVVCANTNGDQNSLGHDVNYLGCVEIDMTLFQKSPGVDPTCNQGHCYGLVGAGGSNLATMIPKSAFLFIDQINVVNGIPWNYGIQTGPGAAVNAFVAGPANSGTSSGSQYFAFQYTSGSTTPLTGGRLNTDNGGNLVAQPAAGGVLSLQDGTGTSLLNVSSSFGNSKVRIPALATNGVLTNAVTTGEVISNPTLPCANFPALTGAAVGTSGSCATTLATAQPDPHTWALAQTFTVAPVFTDASGTRTALGLGALATVTPGAGIATALAANVGFAGAPVLFNGAGGTPSSIVLTNASGTAPSLIAGSVTTNANLTGDVNSVGNATTLTNIPTGTPAPGTILHTNIAAPSSPASGKVSVYSDSTDLRFHDKNAAGTIGTTVVADTGAASNYISAISTAGVITKSRPSCSTLSDGATGCSTAYAASTWTPVVSTTSTVGTPAYTVQFGSYEQIGRQVTVRFNLILSGWTGSPTGNVLITGLPITSANTTSDNGQCFMAGYQVGSTNAPFLGGRIIPNTSQIEMIVAISGSYNTLTTANTGTTPIFQGYCSYHT